MRKLLNNPKVVAGLAVAAVAFVGVSLWPKSIGSAGSAAPLADAAAEENVDLSAPTVTSDSRDLAALRAALQAIIPLEHPRDPFSDRVKTVDQAAALAAKAPVPDRVDTVRLSAIWTQGGATYALIDGQICQAGDQLARMKIESASQDGVWISHGEKRDFLSLGVDFTLVTPAQGSTTASTAAF